LSSQVNVLSEKVKQLSNDVDPIKQKIAEFEDVLKNNR
jgi:outer membrane murein-binding lipoprotein Lpp